MRPSACLPLAVLLLSPVLAGAEPYAFVSGAADNSIGVVDLADDTLAGSFALPGLPSGMAMSSDRTHLFVAQSQLGSLAVIDTATGGVASIPVGVGPAGVAVVGNRLVYVANTSDDTVSAVDSVAGTVLATIPVGEAPLALVAGGRRVYAANWNQGTISVISALTNTVVGSVAVGRFPAGLALNPVARRLYVANFFDDTVSVVDTQALSVLATIPVVRRPRGLALDASLGRLYVAGFEDDMIDVVDTATNAVLFQAPSGGRNPMDLLVGPDHDRLYAVHLEVGSNVRVLDAASLAPLGSIDGPAGPVAMAGLGNLAPPFGSMKGPLGWTADRILHRPAAGPVPARPSSRRASSPTDVTISDTEFAPADWAVSGSGEYDSTQQSTGGNPGFWRRTTHFTSDTTSVHQLIKAGTQYDPASQGPIQSIDVTWDRRALSESLIEERVIVVQNGVVYRGFFDLFSSPAWQTHAWAGLTSDDLDGGSGHPDFTSSGAPIRFGYLRSTSFGNAVHGIDNFLVTVHTLGPSAGSLGFKTTVATVQESPAEPLYVSRLGGTQGAVSVDLIFENPDGGIGSQTLTWADGDNADIGLIPVFTLPSGSVAGTARWTLSNPTGGASLTVNREHMVIFVGSGDNPTQLVALFLGLAELMASFSPCWLLALALPATMIGWRASRGRKGVERA